MQVELPDKVFRSELAPDDDGQPATSAAPTWVINASFLWDNRRTLLRTVGTSFVLSIFLVLLLPKEYESSARIMPPERGGNSASMLAALVGRGSSAGSAGGLAGLAGSLLSPKDNGALFIALLRSGTISGHLIDRFDLQHVYHTRYRDSTAKRLARLTKITEDTKSGVITIVVTDQQRVRARDLAQAYLDELNNIVARVNTSSARREREFIEQRLKTVQRDLQQAQLDLSKYSRENTTIDIKEQTRATVEAGAKLEGQLIANQSELDSLRQIYGDQNVRVRAAQARNSLLRHEMQRADGQREEQDDTLGTDETHPYPALRQLPQLAVQWANLYRNVRIHETVFDLLSEEYETARIEEVKSIPTLSIIDFPGLPERKSGPHRALIVLTTTFLSAVAVSLLLFAKRSWLAMDHKDERRVLVIAIGKTLRSRWRKLMLSRSRTIS